MTSSPIISAVGRVVPGGDNEAIREPPLYAHRILYESKEQDVFVLAVIHEPRDLQPETIER